MIEILIIQYLCIYHKFTENVLIELFNFSHRLETKLNENHIESCKKYGVNNKDKFLIDDLTNWLIILVNNLPNFIFDSLKIRFFHK